MVAGENFGELQLILSCAKCHKYLFYHHVRHENAACHVTVVRGYHEYENVWSAPIDGTELPVENPMDA